MWGAYKHLPNGQAQQPAQVYNSSMHTSSWSSSSGARRAVLKLLLLAMAGAPLAQAGAPMDERLALHLLNRLGYGPAPGDLARVRAMGVAAYVDSQLAPPPLPRYLDARLRELAHPDAPAGEQALLRAIASPRQLEEVLAGFWLDWFMEEQDPSAADAARMALRPLVLGRYAQLVEQARAQGRSPGGRGERAAVRALAGHFVSAPPESLLRSLERVWQGSGGGQRTVLRALFTSPAFLAPTQWNSKRKDDFRFVVSAVRASGVAVNNVTPLAALLKHPLEPGARADFVERLAGGRLALAIAPPQAQRYASSAPPLRSIEAVNTPQTTLAQPGPVLMEAPTPSAAAMAAAARSQPADPERLRTLLLGADFLRY